MKSGVLASLLAFGVFGSIIALAALGVWLVFSWRPTRVEETVRLSEARALAGRTERCARPPERRLVLERRVVAPMLEGDSLAKAATFQPLLRGERLTGFRVESIRPGSLYDQLGLCDGDRIVAIAGRRLDSEEVVLELYEEARGLGEIEVHLLRGASTATLSFAIVLR